MPPTNINFKGLGRKIYIEKGTADEIEWEDTLIKFSSPIAAIDLQDRMIDLMGTHTIVVAAGTEQYGTGKYGRAFDFDNVTRLTITPETAFDFELTDPFSFSLWVNVTTPLANTEIMVAKTTSSGSIGYMFRKTSADTVQFIINNGTTLFFVGSTAIMNTGWNHLVCTYSGNSNRSGMTTYVNNVQQNGSASAITGSMLNNEPMTIGAESDGGLTLTGKMQFFNAYDFELTQTQVTDLFNAQNPYGSVSKTTSAVQDFDMENMDLEVGVNSNHGMTQFTFDDTAKTFLDTTTTDRKSTIRRSWNVEVWCGKKPADAYRAFKGTILSATPIFPSTGVIKQRVFAVGSKETLVTKHTQIKRYQGKQSGDADALDTADINTRISQIAKDLLIDTDHFANQGLTALGFTVNGIVLIDIKLPDFQQNFTSIAQAWEELANMCNCYFGIDAADDAFMHIKGSKDSGLLITNDVDNSILNNWNAKQYSLLATAPNWYDDSIVTGGFAFIHGIGYERIQSDDKFESADAAQDLNDFWVAFPFTPDRDNVATLAPFLAKNSGTFADPLVIEIVEEDGSGAPSGTIKARIEIPAARLEKELDATGKYFEIAIPKLVVVPKTKYFIVIQKYATANRLDLDYLASGGARTWYESDDGGVGDAWSSTGHTSEEIKFREYGSKSTRLIVENTLARSKFGDRETVFPLTDYTHKDSAIVVLGGLSETLGRENRTFPAMTISPPDNEVKVGKSCRITDTGSGLDMTANILSYSLSWNAFDPQSNLGAREMTVIVENLTYG